MLGHELTANSLKKLVLPLRVVICLVGDTGARAIIARTEPDFAMPAFASAFHAEGSCRSSMQSISVTERIPYEYQLHPRLYVVSNVGFASVPFASFRQLR